MAQEVDQAAVDVIKTYPERHSIFAGSYSEFADFCNSFAEA